MKKWKKRTLISGVCCLLAVVLIWNVVSVTKYDYSSLMPGVTTLAAEEFQSKGTDPAVKNMQIAATNDTLELFINPTTTEIAVEDKRTGSIWYSNPQGRSSSGNSADLLSSQMRVAYYNESRQEVFYTSYSDSVGKKQFKVQSIDNGVKVTYTLGTLSSLTDTIPKYISKERFEKLLAKIKDPDNQDAVDSSYIKDTNNSDRMEFLESASNSDINMKRVLAGFKEAGYTSEDLAEDNKQAGITSSSERSYVVVPIEYQLEYDKLSVTIPTGQIQEKGSDKVIYIEPLEFFAAGSQNDTGYLFVPSGCGGIINFNNGKDSDNPYMQTVYGDDPAADRDIRSESTEPIRMPVYGIKKGQDAVFAYIDSGSGDATIVAGVSGKACPYNYVYPRFTLRNTDKVKISQTNGTSTEMNIVDTNFYHQNISVKYCFLKREDSDYSGMARYYREYLTKNGTLQPLKATDNVPFYLDILGAVEKQKYFIGVPYRGIVPMTTYQQAENILSALQNSGVKNVQMRYLGWFNKGINNDVPSSVKMIRQLGGTSALQNLSKKLSATGGQLFLDVAFQQVSAKTWNYQVSKHSARYLDQWSVETANYNRATISGKSTYEDGLFHVVSPNVLPGIVGKFIPKYQKIGVTGLSLRDLGDIMTSDKRKSYPIDREVSKAIVMNQISNLQKNNKLIISGGNSYSWKYSQELVNVPSTGNQYYLLDETIPFYQMVIHGSIDYTGEAVNISNTQDPKTQLLQAIEYGLMPHYMLSYQSGAELQNTTYESYYSTDYRNWLNEAASAYKIVNTVYSKIRTAKIDQFLIPQEGVYETVYDNGITVYVNYTSEPVTIGSVRVDANGYALGGSQS